MRHYFFLENEREKTQNEVVVYTLFQQLCLSLSSHFTKLTCFCETLSTDDPYDARQTTHWGLQDL